MAPAPPPSRFRRGREQPRGHRESRLGRSSCPPSGCDHPHEAGCRSSVPGGGNVLQERVVRCAGDHQVRRRPWSRAAARSLSGNRLGRADLPLLMALPGLRRSCAAAGPVGTIAACAARSSSRFDRRRAGIAGAPSARPQVLLVPLLRATSLVSDRSDECDHVDHADDHDER